MNPTHPTEARPTVSAKGVVTEDGRVWLRQNEFGKWELPGGRVEIGEQPEQTVVRELREELGLETQIVSLLDARMLEQTWSTRNPFVLIISYACRVQSRVGDFEHIGEGGPAQFRAFLPSELDDLDLPELYRIAITKASK